MFELIVQGVLTCLSPINILAMLISVPFGIIVGCLPGFGAATGLVLVLPMTYGMDPATAFVALTGIYIGAEYGGSISAILINTPGTAAAVITAFDGHAMAVQGKARDALLISNIASFSGGLIGGLMMLLFMPILGNFVLKFGAGEVFVMAAVGLLLVGVVTKGNRIKGIISVCLGLMFTFVGADGVSGFSRFDFNIPILIGGLPLIAGLLAMFAIPQMLEVALGPKPDTSTVKLEDHGIRGNLRIFKKYLGRCYREQPGNILRSGIIGVIIGIIPGVGAAVASMASYAAAKKADKHPENFGKGYMPGIAAPESANNALVGGSLIPVLSLGIPGSPAAALYMGAIFLHGMTPGPNFLIKEADLVYLLIMAVFLCSLVQLLVGAFTISSFANILKVPTTRLFPSVIAVCCIGAYVVRTLDFDIDFFIILGIISYILSRLGFNMGAIVLGAFLSPSMESALVEALNIAPAMGGLIPYFQTRPIALCMLGMVGLYLLYVIISSIRQARVCRESEEFPGECLPSEWRGERGTDLGIFIIVFIAAAIFLSMTTVFPEKSRILPTIAFCTTMVCCVLGAIQCIFFSKVYSGRNTSPLALIPWKKLVILGAVMVLYLPLMNLIGFYPATVPYILINAMIIRRWHGYEVNAKAVFKEAVFAVIFTVTIYLIFTVIFQSPMPLPLWLEDMFY